MDEKKEEKREEKETIFEKNRENVYFRWGLTAFIVIVAAVIVSQFVSKLPAFFSMIGSLLQTLGPVLYGLAIAYLLDPIVGRVDKLLRPHISKKIKSPEKAEKLSRGVGILVALAILILIVWALLSMILPQLMDSLNTIIGNLPTYYNTLSGWVSGLIHNNIQVKDFTGEVMDKVYSFFSNWLSSTMLPKMQSFMENLTSSVVGMAKALFDLIIGIIISVYLLLGKRKFLSQAKKFCYGVLGQKWGGYVSNVCSFANQAFGGFIGGKIVDSAIIGVLCFFGMQILGLDYSLLIAIIVGVTNIIPFFGPYLGAIPSALLLLVIDPMQALSFIIFILVLQQVDGNIIGPMILGDATGLDGFWVVVSILIFGSLYGLAGMIFAVPLFAVIYKIVKELINKLLKLRGLSDVTSDYESWNYPPRPSAAGWRRPTRTARRRHLRALKKEAKAQEASKDSRETGDAAPPAEENSAEEKSPDEHS